MKNKIRILVSGLILALCRHPQTSAGQTLVSGNLSGTWSPSGNPYVVTGNSYVSSGAMLTIQPGVVVEIGSGLAITNNCVIQAVGTPGQHIAFNAPVSSQYWNSIFLVNTPGTNRFHYCDFQNARTALSMLDNGGALGVIENNEDMYAEIFNCTFSNCTSQAVLGQSVADNCDNTTLYASIENCSFSGTSNGCVFQIAGGDCDLEFYTYAYVYPTICGNIFQNLTGTALVLALAQNYGSGSAAILNNTVVDCQGGVNVTDPWNVTNENNIFAGCSNAVTLNGSLSQQVSYNDFYENATNFIGYNTNIYGQVIINNRNGTPCDLLYNIYTDPLFSATSSFYLTGSSPCVNAGAPGVPLENICFPPSIGSKYGDMGAYGGPTACNWLATVPLVPAQSLSITNSGADLWLNWYEVPRSTYQILYATNLVGTNQWQNLPDGQLLASGTVSSFPVGSLPPTNQIQFFRIQSLGRVPGN